MKKNNFAVITLCLFSLFTLNGMKSGTPKKSTATISFGSISQAPDKVLRDPSTVASSAFVIGWHSVMNNAKYGFFDSATLKDPVVLSSLAGGIVGKTIKEAVTFSSDNKILTPVKWCLEHPFLTSYVIAHGFYRYNEIKRNPSSFLAEVALLGVHCLTSQN